MFKDYGTITIDGAEKAYGILAEDSTVKVYNYGTITIDGTSCTGDKCKNNAIVLNGGKLFQDGEFISDVIDLSAISGTVLATQNSKFVAKNAISGELVMSSDIVSQGFQTSYTTSNTIDFADKNIQLAKESSLKLNGGVAMYHEFANPYALTLGMNGMDGSFTVRDEKRTDNRAVVRTGFEFTQGKLSLLGNLMSYIDSEYRTNATLDLKYNF